MTDTSQSAPQSFWSHFFTEIQRYFASAGLAFAAVIGLIAAFKDSIEFDAIDLSDPILWALVGGLSIVLGFIALGVWRDRRHENRLIRLGEGDVVEKLHRFRLAPREAEDHDDFVRGDRAHEKIVDWIVSTEEHSFLFFTGRSGSGKSSILSAWALPELRRREPPFVVVEARGHADPLGALTAALLKPGAVWERPPKHEDPRTLMEAAAKKASPSRLLIVIDQFEEFVILNEEDAQAPMRHFLQGLAENPIEGAQILLVARSDREYLAALQELGLSRMALDENWYVIDGFSALEARTFLSGGGLDLSEPQLNAALAEAQELEGGSHRIRPVVLNLIGLAIERHAGRVASLNGLTGQYVRETLRAPELAEDGRLILSRMVTDAGTKRPSTVAGLADSLKKNEGAVSGVLNLLSREGLVRRIDPETGTWEVSHDFVANLIGQAIGRLRPSKWQTTLKWLGPAALALWMLAVLAAWPLYKTVWLPYDITRNGVSLKYSDDGWAVAIDEDQSSPGSDQAEIERLLPLLVRLGHVRSLEVRSQGDLETIEFPILPALSTLVVRNNAQLNALNLLDLPALTTLVVGSNVRLNELNLFDLPALTELQVGHNVQLTALSLLDLPELMTLVLDSNDGLTALNLPDLPALTTLMVYQNAHLTALRLPELPELKKLEVVFNDQLTALSLPNLPALTDLIVDRNFQLTALNLLELPALKTLQVNWNTQLTALNLPDLPVLTTLMVENNSQLTALSLPDLPTLTKLEVSNNDVLAVLNLPDLPALSTFRVRFNAQLTALNLPDLPELTKLVVENNAQLAALNSPDLPLLTTLEVLGNDQLTALSLPDLPLLTTLEVRGNDQLTALSLPDLPALSTFRVQFNAQLTALNLPDLPELTKLVVENNAQLAALNSPDLPALEMLLVYGNHRLVALNLQGIPSVKQTLVVLPPNVEFSEALRIFGVDSPLLLNHAIQPEAPAPLCEDNWLAVCLNKHCSESQRGVSCVSSTEIESWSSE